MVVAVPPLLFSSLVIVLCYNTQAFDTRAHSSFVASIIQNRNPAAGVAAAAELKKASPSLSSLWEAPAAAIRKLLSPGNDDEAAAAATPPVIDFEVHSPTGLPPQPTTTESPSITKTTTTAKKNQHQQQQHQHIAATTGIIPQPSLLVPSPSLSSPDHHDKTTPFASFGSSILTSLTLTLFTEFGDRTFFIAAILSLQQPKLIVLTATSLALVIQTIFSTLAGQLLHLIPNNSTTSKLFAIPLDDYAAAVLLFLFGFIHLKAALCDPDSNNAVPTLLEEEADDCYYPLNESSKRPRQTTPSTSTVAETAVAGGGSDHSDSNRGDDDDDDQLAPLQSDPPRPQPLQSIAPLQSTTTTAAAASATDDAARVIRRPSAMNSEYVEAEKATRAIATSSSISSLQIFRQIFWVIFVAELGDKSMISTVALSAAQNPVGVFIGSSIAHCFVTLIAVIAGSLLEGYISERVANGIGAFLFLTFGIMATLEGLARQGVRLWWIIGEKTSAFFLAYIFITGERSGHSGRLNYVVKLLSSQ